MATILASTVPEGAVETTATLQNHFDRVRSRTLALVAPRLRDAVLAHPTMAEGLGPLFSNVPARSGQ
jgi:hypothetical protein